MDRSTVADWRRALGFGRSRPTPGSRLAGRAAKRVGGLATAGLSRSARRRVLHLTAAPGAPLRPLRDRDRPALARLGWTTPVAPDDFGRLVRVAVGADVTLCVHRSRPE